MNFGVKCDHNMYFQRQKHNLIMHLISLSCRPVSAVSCHIVITSSWGQSVAIFSKVNDQGHDASHSRSLWQLGQYLVFYPVLKF